jgi:hypothetical protein
LNRRFGLFSARSDAVGVSIAFGAFGAFGAQSARAVFVRSLWLAVAVFGLARTSHAQLGGYSTLERSVIEQKLSERSLSLEPAPEGKRIEEIQIVPLDVFDERDPMPDFVNVFHATTREHVIRRELLFEEGMPYRAALVDESARNLRTLIQ